MLDFIPRKQVVAHLESGWRLIPSHDYAIGDYAILMQKQPDPEPLTSEQIKALFDQIDPPPPPPTDRNRCKRGHYLSGDNIYTRPDGYTACRQCKRQLQANYMKRQRAAEFA